MSRQNQTIAFVSGGALMLAAGGAMLATNNSEPAAVPAEPPQVQESVEQPAGMVTAQSAARDGQSGDSVTHDTDHLTFSARFPEAEDLRVVATALREETNAYLERLDADARSAAASSTMPQWEVNIHWRPIATSDGFASLIGRSQEYRGGAHPVQLVDTRLMRIADGEEIPQGELFNGRYWPTPAVAIAVCEELKAAKTAHIGSATIFDEPIVCAGPRSNIRLDEARLAFAASQTGDAFGGLHVLYQPYVVGSYAEGAYEFTIPADVFREDIKKEYVSLFNGPPAPLEN